MKGKGLDQKGFWDHERMKGTYAHTNVNTYILSEGIRLLLSQNSIVCNRNLQVS